MNWIQSWIQCITKAFESQLCFYAGFFRKQMHTTDCGGNLVLRWSIMVQLKRPTVQVQIHPSSKSIVNWKILGKSHTYGIRQRKNEAKSTKYSPRAAFFLMYKLFIGHQNLRLFFNTTSKLHFVYFSLLLIFSS